MASTLTKIRNYFFPSWQQQRSQPDSKQAQQNLNTYPQPVQLQRLRVDVLSWRDSIREAEQAYYPHRVKMQRVFQDTILNGHVISCMERRRDLNLLRKFQFGVDDKVDKQWTEFFQAQWFKDGLGYIIDSEGFGYSLISVGDLVADSFPDLGVVRRHNISPDRHNVTSYVYSLSGADFLADEYKDWHIWVPTPNDIGVSNCGYGYLYPVALYEIFLRNLLGFNGDFVELYAQPYRVGKTSKTEEAERAELEAAIRAMGSSGYAIIDPEDEIAFLETALGGTGYKGYTDLEARCEKKISKIILGHADALDSVPGKLGSGQGDDNPVAKALLAKQQKDGEKILNVVNNQWLPKLRNIGINIPQRLTMSWANDEELKEQQERENDGNLKVATIAQAMKNAGLKMSAKYFKERTGIECEEIPAPLPLVKDNTDKNGNQDPGLSDKIKNQLKRLYR